MRWRYGLVALVGLAIGWGSVNLGRYLVSWASPVKVLPLRVELGEVVEGTDASFAVRIVNGTDQTLNFVRFNASICGCFFEHQKLPQAIPPHTKVTLTFGLRTDLLPDKFQEQLTFVLTDPYGRAFTPTVTITGKVLREVEVAPNLVDFGTVLLGG